MKKPRLEMNAKCWSLTAHFCKAVIVIFRQTWDSNLLLAKEIRSLSVVFLQNRKMFNVLYPGIQCLGCHLCNPMVLPFHQPFLNVVNIVEYCEYWILIVWVRDLKIMAALLPRSGYSLYKLYRYVLPHWVWFLRHFGLESGMVFEGTTECMNISMVSIPNE